MTLEAFKIDWIFKNGATLIKMNLPTDFGSKSNEGLGFLFLINISVKNQSKP